MGAAVQQRIQSELDALTPEAKQKRARQQILKFCREKRNSKDGPVNHTVSALRNRFDTIGAQSEAIRLGVSWQSLIDEMIRTREVRVANGFVWVP
jgi:septal ring factor EnvC (AmiA/AmiB activator)